MSAAYSSRDIVEDYLRYKLLNSGVAWRVRPARTGGWRPRREQGAPTSWLSWRSEGARSHQPDSWLAPPRLQVVLRCAGDELEHHYRGDLSAHVSVLLQGDAGLAARRRSLTVVREELFRDGVNWGRIVAMMELCGALCAEVVKTGGTWQVDDIAGWMEESLDSPPLRGWIEDNGGWVGVSFLTTNQTPLSFLLI
ncbi:apoptosis regulator Bcl-2-like [Micropterus salmoides]|uniref:apoptosis regulator Bcl-2-like n=1 Tax=Micropterus salmoides TaxID=27706 RepID=UPI0018EB7741|nr:apoptosis regulator Bcl-2-like [Micropterus salmoides]